MKNGGLANRVSKAPDPVAGTLDLVRFPAIGDRPLATSKRTRRARNAP